MVTYYRDLAIGPVIVAHDGKASGPFNRSAAYNRGMAQIDADVYLWNEGDSLVPHRQIKQAIQMAYDSQGLVIPFTERHELSPAQTRQVLNGADPFEMRGAADVFPDKMSVGQAGVTSRETMRAIGGRWDEGFSGWGYDDNAMHYLFATLAGPPRWVDGKAIHLYHKPGYAEPSPEQAEATRQNEIRFHRLQGLGVDALRREMSRG